MVLCLKQFIRKEGFFPAELKQSLRQAGLNSRRHYRFPPLFRPAGLRFRRPISMKSAGARRTHSIGSTNYGHFVELVPFARRSSGALSNSFHLLDELRALRRTRSICSTKFRHFVELVPFARR